MDEHYKDINKKRNTVEYKQLVIARERDMIILEMIMGFLITGVQNNVNLGVTNVEIVEVLIFADLMEMVVG